MMKPNYDVLILGGGPAGLSAALSLGRIGRTALVVDDGRPRNAPAAHMNNFPSHDGLPPAEWRRLVREDLKKYETIDLRSVSVSSIVREGHGFFAAVDDREIRFKKIILAHGIQDRLPEIPGVHELFGKSVFHCPYCHGFEVRGRALALLANGEFAFHMMTMLSGLSDDLVLFTNGPSTVSEDHFEILKRNGVKVVDTPLEQLNYEGERLLNVRLTDGRHIARDAMFLAPSFPLQMKSAIGLRLGCVTNEFGTFKIDEFNRTTVPGVFAAGDIVEPRRQSVLLGAASGAIAGSAVVHELLSEQFASNEVAKV